MSEQEQIVYKNIVCIYTSHKHIDMAIKLKDKLPSTSEWKYFIFIANGYDGEVLSDDVVSLDVDEGYELLSLKTYQMLKYIHRLDLNFERIYKIDATVYTGETCIRSSEKLENITKNFFNEDSTKHYDGARQCTCGKGGMRIWALDKNLSNFSGTQKKWYDSLSKKIKIKYFSGKFYIIDRVFFNYIINESRIEHLSQLMFEEWGGCEDLMIGLLWEDFKQRDK